MSTRTLLLRVPLMLVWLRLVLAPAMVLLALYRPLPAAFAVCLLTGLLSDFFDGVIARRLGVATAGLRRFDSITDTVFILAALAAVWVLHPAELREWALPLAILLMLEVGRYLLDFVKFRREASYHMWSAKLWALSLYLAFYVLLVPGEPWIWVGLAIGLGILSDLEGLFISLVLPVWHHDVPSLVHAWRLRTLRSADDR